MEQDKGIAGKITLKEKAMLKNIYLKILFKNIYR